MTTPNIEELIAAAQNYLHFHKRNAFFASDRDVANNLMGLLSALQSQAERIKVLEREAEMRRITLHDVMLESDTLRAQLAAIAATEPVYYLGGGRLYGDKTSALFDNANNAVTELFTRPVPAQDVTELVEALEKLARLGNGEHYGNSDGNMIARTALSNFQSGEVITKPKDFPAFPCHPEPRIMKWSDLEIETIQTYAKQYAEALGRKAK